MQVDCGRYILKTDPLNMWIEEKYENKKGETATRPVTGYVQDFEKLLVSFVGHKVRECDLKANKADLEVILIKLNNIEKELKCLAEEIGKDLGKAFRDD